VDGPLKEQYYYILRVIMNRGEFHLSSIGFDSSYSYLIQDQAKNIQFNNRKSPSLNELKDLNQKSKIGQLYQTLLYKALEKAL